MLDWIGLHSVLLPLFINLRLDFPIICESQVQTMKLWMECEKKV